MADDDSVMEPQENPEGTGHLPAAGEVGSGQVSYHDPVTQPTDDDVAEAETPDVTEDQPSLDEGGAAGLS